MTVTIHPITGVPRIRPGDDLAKVLLNAIENNGFAPQTHDILVVCQKIVSKAEGRVVDIRGVTPSAFAERIAATTHGKDPRVIEVILGETRRIVKMARGHLITETGPGWICANAGVDESNSGDPNHVVLLPLDPDASAQRLLDAVRARHGCDVGVIVTDTFGRPWREGLVDFALGVAGIAPLLDLRGTIDLDRRELRHTVLAQADALAAAAGLVMRKGDGIPAALVRGYRFERGGGGKALIRSPEQDLFR